MTTESGPGDWEQLLHPPDEPEPGEGDDEAGPHAPKHSWQAADGLRPLRR